MNEFLRIKNETDQFQQLISAITSSGGSGGAGPWVLGATNVTSYSLQGIPADEFLVIQKMRLPNNTYSSTVFTFPKSSLLTAGTLIDGYYYNANYYGSFGIKLSSNEIINDSSWTRMYYDGTTITTATMDVYYRSNQGGGGSAAGLSEIARFTSTNSSSLYNSNNWNALNDNFTFNLPVAKECIINVVLYGVDSTGNAVNSRILIDDVEVSDRLSRNTTTTIQGNWTYCNTSITVQLDAGSHSITIEGMPVNGTGVIAGWNATVKG